MESLGVVRTESLTGTLPRQITAVGGGKGGVGKSVLAISLSYWLARLNKRVILVDCDLGGANLHTMLGIRVPKFTLEDFLQRRVSSLEDVLLPTPFENVRLLAGGNEVASLANPNHAQKSRLLRSMWNLDADHILVDLGAGQSLNTLDFFIASPRKIAVLTPQPTSVQNAYGFIKTALYRTLNRQFGRIPGLREIFAPTIDSGRERAQRTMDELLEEADRAAPAYRFAVRTTIEEFRVSLIVNMVDSPQQAVKGDIVRQVCERYLNLNPAVLGSVPTDSAIDKWIGRMMPGDFFSGDVGGANRSVYEIAYRMAGGIPLSTDRQPNDRELVAA